MYNIQIWEMNKQISFFFLLLFSCFQLNSQSNLRIDPPFWWEGMHFDTLQLMVYGKGIAALTPAIGSTQVEIRKVKVPENPDYLFIDIKIKEEAKKGFEILFRNNKGKAVLNYYFELKQRREGSAARQGFNSSDAIYLLMPDRFSNANPENDYLPGMLEKSDRQLSLGRHGGDLKGIQNNLGYIEKLGFTALWLNPVLENNMYTQSYHGYAITDFYKVDPRFGSNEQYVELIDSCHKLGLKMIMDMVFNHAGTRNRFIVNRPMSDWVNTWPGYTPSNYRGEVATDPYASDFDRKKMNDGWFDTTMADLNQRNPFVLKYLIQNSIWWIEYAGLDGIRMDTYPYPDKDAMSLWAKAIHNEYPNFTIVGEAWLQMPAHVSVWQKDSRISGDYNSNISSVFDFPLYFAMNAALNEPDGWMEGFARLYNTFNQDMLYSNPDMLVVFPDNHDVGRISDVLQNDILKFKQAMAFYATVRGIPQFYYGTEIMMSGNPYFDHGSWRRDFPGGWQGDDINAFTGQGLTAEQLEAQQFVQKLLTWRKENPVIHSGKFKHFIPQDGVYVYARFNNEKTILIILNKNTQPYSLKLNRFQEVISGHTKAYEVITESEIGLGESILLTPSQAMILELK